MVSCCPCEARWWRKIFEKNGNIEEEEGLDDQKKDIMKNRLIMTERSFFSSAKIVIFSLRS